MLSPEQQALWIYLASTQPPPNEEHQRRHRAEWHARRRANRRARRVRNRRRLATHMRTLADRLAPATEEVPIQAAGSDR